VKLPGSEIRCSEPGELSFATFFQNPSLPEPIQLPLDVLNLSNDLGDDFPLNQARKGRCRIGQNSSGVSKQCSEHRLANPLRSLDPVLD